MMDGWMGWEVLESFFSFFGRSLSYITRALVLHTHHTHHTHILSLSGGLVDVGTRALPAVVGRG